MKTSMMEFFACRTMETMIADLLTEINAMRSSLGLTILYYCRVEYTKERHLLYFFVKLIARKISISAIVVKILHLACYQMATRCFLGVLAANFSLLTISPGENSTPSLRKLIGYLESRLFPCSNISVWPQMATK